MASLGLPGSDSSAARSTSTDCVHTTRTWSLDSHRGPLTGCSASTGARRTDEVQGRDSVRCRRRRRSARDCASDRERGVWPRWRRRRCARGRRPAQGDVVLCPDRHPRRREDACVGAVVVAAGLKEQVDQAGTTQALAQTRPASTVLSVFQDVAVKARLAVALNSHPGLALDRFLMVASTECSRNPKLLQCTRGSFLQALEMSAHLGLEVGGPLGHFYLVPFKNNKRGGGLEVVPILGYKGIIVLARRSGQISDMGARRVYAKDFFEWEYGLEDSLVHRPAMDKDRGEIVAFYGIARFTNGGRQMLTMSKSEVDSFRGRSRASDDGPWKTDYTPMGSKTGIRGIAPHRPPTLET